ncbi:cytochrome P450 [Streptomyces sp. SID5910]|uniref:cytochrome P450 n=1 Tax=Streptomyces sp. SID5910 TaxID=2690312 RepID=UPI00136D0A25|nr:cytochrome P450 [Streptomyces sp. SID5910]MYR44672.1 cytochrome P450 [Streptomyces sp. SID5910]
MSSRRLVPEALALLTEGYAWLPDLMRAEGDTALDLRVLGRPALAMRGPDAVRFFYDEAHVRRHGALPGPVLSTLFGHGAVHTLDGDEHRRRKSFFLPLLETDAVTGSAEHIAAAWDEAVPRWRTQPDVVLFVAVSRVIARGVCRWAGVPLTEDEEEPLARDLVAMVDGFATAGPRHWRARRARARQERRFADLVTSVRSGAVQAPAGSVLDRVCRHRDASGAELTPEIAAVELLNVVRPATALSWFVAFAAHALHRRPELAVRLRSGEAGFATAFAHEVRRFYPFAPFLGGKAVTDLTWQGRHVPAGGLVLLDVHGQNHDERLWKDPYAFRPERFLDHPPGRDELIPQGGADPRTGHRCPGEALTVGILETLSRRLADLDYDVPPQDLTIPLNRIPTRPRSGMIIRPLA